MKHDRARLMKLLERDKAEINEASRRAALEDFKRVANEYFETDGGYLLTMREDKETRELVFTCRIVRVKNFTVLP